MKFKNKGWQFNYLLLPFICFLYHQKVLSQDSFLDDTIHISEVVISGQKPYIQLSGYNTITIDSSVLNDYGHKPVASILLSKTGISVKSYGLVGTSSPSMRGTGAGHALIQWNNITINNPMLGQSDLSLLPSGLFDEVEIMYGGASLLSGTGGIGGIISFENKPSWNPGTVIVLDPGIESFGRYTSLIKVKTGNSQFQSVTRGFVQYGKNDFTYINRAAGSEPLKEKMLNSESFSKGFIEELYYRRKKNSFSAKLWYHDADRNLPASMLTSQTSGNEHQFDKSFRTILSYETKAAVATYFITGSFNLTDLSYRNKIASIDSRNEAQTYVLKTGLTKNIGNDFLVKAIIEEENTLVKSVNYLENRTRRNLAALTLTADKKIYDRFGITILAKQILHEKQFLFPDYSAGLQYRLFESSDHFLKANYSRNSRVPTMNDLFWNPGGNTDLRTETAHGYEVSYDMKQRVSEEASVQFQLSYYKNSINDLIQWRPGKYSYWTAENVKKVHTTGFESSATAGYKYGKMSAKLTAGYYFTKATTDRSEIINDESIGKQLIYVPQNSANVSLLFDYGGIYSEWMTTFTGKRYTIADNSISLPSYFLNNFTAGYEFAVNGNRYKTCFSIDNIFNKSYETIAWYAQPGRSYSLKLTIQFSIKK